MWSNSLYQLYFKDKTKFNDLYIQRFESENAKKFDFNIYHEKAFYFHHIDISKMMFNISMLDKKVTILLSELPDYAKVMYIKKSLIDEVLYTNEIEGIISTRKEISEIINNIKDNQKKKPNKIQSLINKYMMLVDNDREDNIKDCNDVRKLYDELVLDDIISFDPKDKPDGLIFRASAVQVLNESSGKVMHEGVLKEENIISLMSEAINFLNSDSYEPLIRIAIFHYIFSYIHPFYDGNGRTNRFISSLYLKHVYNPIISFRISLTIKENKKQYYEAFNITNSKYNKGDITSFVYEYINIIEKAYEKTYEYLSLKKNQLDEGARNIDLLNIAKLEKDVLWCLFQIELFKGDKPSIKQIAEFINSSEPTTKKVLNSLLDRKLINEEKQSRFKVYSLLDFKL